MSISTIYNGESGVQTMADAMSVIGNNIANAETIGYRSSRANFQDLLSHNMTTAQTGCGSTVASITNDFSAGSIEMSSSPLDLALSGKGFFVLKQGAHDDTGSLTVHPDSDLFYTRAFQFRVDKDGYLVNANRCVAQGWEFVEDVFPSSTPTDIRIDLGRDIYSTEQVTSQLRMIGNLDCDATDNSPGVNGLAANWNATNDEPLPRSAYDLKTSQKIYDSAGSQYINVYYDKSTSNNTWEYLITYEPTSAASANDGLLARGEIAFSDTGFITGMTMERYSGGGWVPQSEANDTVNGHFTFSTPLGDGDVEFDIGTAYVNGTWVNDGLTTTQYANASHVIYVSSNGFDPFSYLSSIAIDSEGVITGTYSDGHQTELYRLALATFQNPFGLSPVGKSLFMATDTSGDINYFTAGMRTDYYSNMAKITSHAIERSNVKMANELMNIIITQRGFQAAAKGMSAGDSMLQTAINMMK
jgi:flagellar hook protein FlgE